MNTRRKGNAFQAWVATWLRERGWIVRNFPVTVRPITTPKGKVFAGQKLDVWGADLVARKESVKRDYGDDHALLWIQASMSGGVKKRVAEFGEHFKFLLPGEQLQVWIKTPKGVVNVSEVDLSMGIAVPLGKIIRGKWFASEGSHWSFGEERKP